MPATDDVIDSPVSWVSKHIRTYTESNGKQGHRWHGTDTLLLTTRGRVTGKRRRTALIYGQDSDRYVVVASNGGKPRHPLWYANLVAEPRVEVQIGGDVFDARARTAQGHERARLWQLMVQIFPEYERMQPRAARAGREIPVVVIERVG